MRGWSLCLLVVLLAGCVDPPTLVDPPAARAELGPYRITCGPGLRWEPNPDVCSVSLSERNETRTEATTAIHPTRPDTWVIGFNAITPEPQEAEEPLSPDPIPDPLGLLPKPPATAVPCARFGPCYHVTQDAGATWSEFGVPAVAGGFAAHDPTPLFLGNRLLVAGLFQADLDDEGNAGRGGLFLMSTDDLGVTWREHLVMEGAQDRPWLNRMADGSAVLTWMEGLTVGVARSNDRGETWTFAEPLDCRWQSRAVAAPDGFWVVCGTDRAHGYRFDADLRIVAHHEWAGLLPIWPFVFATTDGGFVLVGEGYETGLHHFLRVRPNGGSDGLVGWYRASPILGQWNWSHVLAAGVDATDAIHVLVAGGEGMRCDNSWCDDFRNRQIAHIVLDGTNGGWVEERLLTPMDGRARSDDQEARRSPLQDDFAGVALLEDRMLLVWSHYWRAEMAFAQQAPRTA